MLCRLIEDLIFQMLAKCRLKWRFLHLIRGKPQLSAHEVESSWKTAHIRIHRERVIGTLLCANYGIFNGVIPLEMLSTRETEKECTLDQIVSVYSEVVNMCESGLPLTWLQLCCLTFQVANVKTTCHFIFRCTVKPDHLYCFVQKKVCVTCR